MSKVALLIPAHNEETVIEETIKSLLKLVPADDIFVVNDGSVDRTKNIAKKYTDNILNLYPNQGKATAMNEAIAHFNLIKRFKYIMPMDADTIITPTFLDQTLPVLENDTKKELACVVGKVTGRSFSWITIYRLWEYEVVQTIHKSAQEKEGAIIVCPGCATLYRSEVFQKMPVPTGTLTEDMDFTFSIHRQNLGKIAFNNKAWVITQDPATLKDFIKQIDRWYTGFWQCIEKHNFPWGGQALDFEVSLLASEGLFNGILVIFMAFLIPFTLVKNPSILALILVIDLLFFIIPTIILTSWRYKKVKLFLYIPHLYLLRIITSVVFLRCFLREVLKPKSQTIWNEAARYQIKETP